MSSRAVPRWAVPGVADPWTIFVVLSVVMAGCIVYLAVWIFRDGLRQPSSHFGRSDLLMVAALLVMLACGYLTYQLFPTVFGHSPGFKLFPNT